MATIAIVSGCGGGGSEIDAPPPTSGKYVIYKDNANGHVVLDGAQTQFAVKSSNQKMVHLASASELNGLLVTSNGDITRAGEKIAAIILAARQDGKTIARLACTGPAPNYGAMTITVSAQGWTHQCASDTGGSGSGDGGQSGANECVSIDRTSNSLADFWINRCGSKVTVRWIDQGNCKNGCLEWVPASSRATITKVKGNAIFAACTYPATPVTAGRYDWQGGEFTCVN